MTLTSYVNQLIFHIARGEIGVGEARLEAGSRAREEEREGERRVGELITFGVGVRNSLALVLEIFRVLDRENSLLCTVILVSGWVNKIWKTNILISVIEA